jgi:hypothetical protein
LQFVLLYLFCIEYFEPKEDIRGEKHYQFLSGQLKDHEMSWFGLQEPRYQRGHHESDEVSACSTWSYYYLLAYTVGWGWQHRCQRKVQNGALLRKAEGGGSATRCDKQTRQTNENQQERDR